MLAVFLRQIAGYLTKLNVNVNQIGLGAVGCLVLGQAPRYVNNENKEANKNVIQTVHENFTF
ncbi:MAG: hypothetical protein OFPII_29770 [Osedax symbiont Rs1]|nr:MAG: hypothetical protein OFPII_29770 [Osedax symbiont Rs1]